MIENSANVKVEIYPEEKVPLIILEQETQKLGEDFSSAGIEWTRIEMTGEGVKGIGLDPNSLLVTVLASGGIITSFITLLQNYLMTNEKRRIKIVIDGDVLELTNASRELQEKIVKAYLRKHKLEATHRGKRRNG